MLEHEAQGSRRAVTLAGKPYLAGELQSLDRYIATEIQRLPPDGASSLRFRDLSGLDWSGYPVALYAGQELPEIEEGRAAAKALAFLKWLAELHPARQAELEVAAQALKSGRKEVERLHKVHRHLTAAVHSRAFIPAPTDSLENLVWQEAMSASQWPEVVERDDDVFEVLTKNSKRGLAYLRGQAGGRAVVFKADPALAAKLQPGDRLPLKLGRCTDGAYILEGCSPPLPRRVPAGDSI